MLEQRLELGSEEKRSASPLPSVIEWLLPKAITRQGQRPLLLVPHRERKHASGALQRLFDPPKIEAREKNFGVRMPAPVDAVTLTLKVSTELPIIVNFSVKAKDVTPRRREHRLMSGGRQVNDRQSPMAEADLRVGVD